MTFLIKRLRLVHVGDDVNEVASADDGAGWLCRGLRAQSTAVAKSGADRTNQNRDAEHFGRTTSHFALFNAGTGDFGAL